MNRSAVLLGLALLIPTAAAAQDLSVLTAGAYRSVLAELAPAIEQQTGTHLVIQNDTAGGVAQKLRAGATPDLVVLPTAAAAGLGAQLGPAQPLAKVGIGVAVPAGAPKPDISTEASLRATVLAARAPAWIDPAAGGSSGIYLSQLWARWSIAATLAPKAVLVTGGLVADALLDNKADLAFQQLSELTAVAGIQIVGPLPASVQSYTTYSGAVPAGSPNRAAAGKVLAILSSPAAAPALQAHGMEPP